MFFKLFILSQIAFSGEPDNFSARLDPKAEIANASLNQTVNLVLSRAIEDVNFKSKNKSCDKSMLMNALKDDLDRNFPNITNYVYLNLPFSGPLSYSDVPYVGSIPYGRTTYSPSVKIKTNEEDFYIGIDKIDHFFSHGFLYWSIVGEDPKLPDEKVKKALELGIAQEEGPWGLQFTGVKSYGDLSANYKGMTFWRDLLNGDNPIVACENNQFVLKRPFELENYFDSSMDESVNCSSFVSEDMLKSIKTFTDKNNVSCPVSPAACERFVKTYPKIVAENILHPLCKKTGASQIEKASKLTSKDIIDGVQGLFSGGGNLFNMLFPPKKGSDTKASGVLSK